MSDVETTLRISGDAEGAVRATSATAAGITQTGTAARDAARQYEQAGASLAKVVGGDLARAGAGASAVLKSASDRAAEYNRDLLKLGRDGMATAIQQHERYGVALRDLATQHGVAATSLQRFRHEQDAAAKAAGAAAAAQKKAAAEVAQAQERFRSSLASTLTSTGVGFTAALTAPIVAIGVNSVKAAASFESAFANVRKTVGQVGPDLQSSERFFARFAKTIRQMALDIPQSVEELSRIAALGGQFGISAQGLEIFTRTIADLSVAIDGMTIDTAAEGLAQLRNITREAEPDVSRMASVLVHLGNNGASSEQQILELSQRIAGAGKEVGLTTPQIMGISAAIANVGINAEAGGTAFSRTLTQMSAAVDLGGAKLDAFAQIAAAGNATLIQSSEDFARVFKTNTIGAIDAFIIGLKNSKDAGANLTLLMQEFGAEGARQADTIRRMAGAATDLGVQIRLADEAWAANNKHTEEAQQKYQTFANQLVGFRNQLREVGIELGTAMLPVLRQMLEASRPLVAGVGAIATAFADLPQPVQTAFLAMGVGAASVGPLLIVAGQAIQAAKGVRELVAAWKALQAAEATATAVGALSTSTTLLSGSVARLLPRLIGPAALVVAFTAVQAAALGAATGEDTLTNRLVAGLTPISMTIRGWRDWHAELQKISATLADTTAAKETASVLSDLAVVVGHDLTRAWRDVQAAVDPLVERFHALRAEAQRMAAAVATDVQTALRQGIGVLRELGQHVGLFLPDSLTRAIDAFQRMRGAATAWAEGLSSSFRLWRQHLREAADGIREVEAAQRRLASLPPPDMFRGAGRPTGDLDDLLRGVTARATTHVQAILDTAARARVSLRNMASANAQLADQYAKDLAKIGRAGMQAALEQHNVYKVSLKEAAESAGIAETSLARYAAEQQKAGQATTKTTKALRDQAAAAKKLAEDYKRLREENDTVVDRFMDEQKARLGRNQKAILDNLKAQTDAEQRAADLVRRLTMSEVDYKVDALAREGRARQEMLSTAAGNYQAAFAALTRETEALIAQVFLGTKEGQASLAQSVGALLGPLAGGASFGAFQEQLEEVGKASEGVRERLNWDDQLASLARGFEQLGNIAQGQLAETVRWIGVVLSAMQLGGQAGANLAKLFGRQEFRNRQGEKSTLNFAGFRNEFGAIDTQSALAGGANTAMNAIAGIGAMQQATSNRSRGKNIAGGALTGAQIGGAIVPGWGHLVGAGVGAIVGAFRGKALRDITAGVKRDFADTEISEDLSKEIEKVSKEKFRKNQQAANVSMTGSILQEAGGVKATNVDAFSKRARDAFAMLDMKKFNIEDTRKVVEETFGALAGFYEKTGTVINKELRDIVRLNKEMKVESQAVTEFVTRQASTLANGVGAMITPLLTQFGGLSDKIAEARKNVDEAQRGDGDATAATKELTDLLAQQQAGAVKSADELQRLSRLTLASFNAGKKNGLDYDDVLEGNAGNLQALLQLEKDLGVTIENGAIRELMAEQQLVDKYRDRIEAVRTINETTVAFANLNAMTAETFADLQAQGLAAYASLQEAGFTEEQILRRMVPFLETIREQHWETNFALDAGTQRMLEQAEASDLLGGKTKDTATVMRKASRACRSASRP